ncbi:MAG: heparinase II/III family protein, partial [Angelakisella sp.]
NAMSDQSVTILVPEVTDQVSVKRSFPATGGKTYMLEVWVQATTPPVDQNSDQVPPSCSMLGKVTPVKSGAVITKHGKPLEYPIHNNTKGTAIKTGWVCVRSHFALPAEADSVIFDAVASGVGTMELAKAELRELPAWQEVIGKYSSKGVSHPIGANINKMFASWQTAPMKKENAAMVSEGLAPLLAMSEAELIRAAAEDAATRITLDIHPQYETYARQLCQKYAETKDEKYARAAILIMNTFAESYDEVPHRVTDNDLFHAHGKFIPVHCLFGYDLIYNSPEWEKDGKEYRETVEGWFRTSFMNLYQLSNDVYLSNIVPYGIRNMAGFAVIMNDPDAVRLMLPWLDTMLSGRQFHADGMWQEGTIAYGQQVVGNIQPVLNLLASCYQDPEGYVDSVLGLQLHHTDLSARWPMLSKSMALKEALKFPNGTTVGIHDTWTNGQKSNEKVNHPGMPLLKNNLNNIELWHFGHFALTQGDIKNATQVHMTFPPLAEGLPYAAGHYHGNHLGIILWGSGMEMLPDSGYPKGANRYFNMDTQSHNTSWVWHQDAEPYKERESHFMRPSLLAYDDGTTSGKEVQLLEASSVGTKGDMVDMKRRLLFMVRTQENRSYVLDLQRLKGGEAHELFLHASEDESCAMTTSLKTTEHNTSTLADYLKETGHEEGLKKFRPMFRKPAVAEGDEDFSFKWVGNDTGTSLHVFMNGVEDSEAIFSKASTNRRTLNAAEKMNSFPNWHFYRRCLVEQEDITRFGAVYETCAKDEAGLVKSVTWTDAEDDDPMTQIATIEHGSFIDTVYISDDTQERTVEGIQFAGKAAIARKDSRTGHYVWGYVYGEGHIYAGDLKAEGKQDLRYTAVSTVSNLEPGKPNSITVNEALANSKLKGVWLRTELSDGSGYGMKITGISGSEISVHDTVPFKITDEGVTSLYFPSVKDSESENQKLHSGNQAYFVPRLTAGTVKVEIRQPSFITATAG